jgi:hypothetical protein
LNASLGFIVDGIQKETGLIPKPDGTQLFSIGGYFSIMSDFGLGIELNDDFYSLTRAVRTNYKPFTLYEENILRLAGLYDIYFSKKTGIALTLKGGINFTSLNFSNDYRNLIINSAGLYPPTTSASGIGYYALFELKGISSSGFTYTGGFGYEYLDPFYEGATKPLDAGYIPIYFRIGYRF